MTGHFTDVNNQTKNTQHTNVYQLHFTYYAFVVCFSGTAAVTFSWVLWELIFQLSSCLMHCNHMRQV